MSANVSVVGLRLNLSGQREAILGLTQTRDAIQGLGTAAVETADLLKGSFADVDTAVTSTADTADVAYVQTADTAETSAARIVDSNMLAITSLEEWAASMRTVAGVSVGTARQITTSLGGVGATVPRMISPATAALGGMERSLMSIKSLVVGGFLYEATKQITGFVTASAKLQTLGGLSPSQASSYSGVATSIANLTGSSPTSVLSAVYNPVSEGFNQSQAKDVLTWAAKIAKMGGAQLEGQAGTSYAMSTLAQTLYGGQKGGPTAQQIAGVAGLLMGTVGAGDMNVPGVLGAESTGIFNTAEAFGLSPQSTASYLAFMTSQGVDPTEAGTRGRMAISMIAAPSPKGAGIDKALGLAPTQEMQDMQKGGLGAALADFQAHMVAHGILGDNQAITLAARFGGAKTDSTILAMVNHLGLLAQFDARVGALSDPARAEAAWVAYTKTPAFQWSQLTTKFQELELVVGNGVLPGLKALAKVLQPFMTVAATKVGGDVMAGLLGAALVKKVLALVTATKAAGVVGGVLTQSGGIAEGAAIRSMYAGETVAAAGGAGPLAVAAVGTAGPIAFAVASEAEKQRLMGLTGGAALGRAGGWVGVNKAGDSFGKPAVDWLWAHHMNANDPKAIAALQAAGFHSPVIWGANGQKLAAGGTIGGGFTTSGPMAVIGEGNSSWPEFVIPTDPAYRARALGLFGSLGAQLLGGASKSVDSSIITSLPAGLFRTTMLGLVNQMFTLASGTAGPAVKLSAPTNAGKGGGGLAGNVGLGQRMAAAMGWTGSEWNALYSLGMAESSWNNLATNPSSGAYGIAQALPASKYPTAGQAAGGSSPAAQIGWMLSYIKGRYGDPLGAWSHEQSNHWYAKGGLLPVRSYDSGGLLPEGFSIAHNGTGAPEPVGHGLAGGDLTVQVVLDRKVIGQKVIHHFQDKMARR